MITIFLRVGYTLRHVAYIESGIYQHVDISRVGPYRHVDISRVGHTVYMCIYRDVISTCILYTILFTCTVFTQFLLRLEISTAGLLLRFLLILEGLDG